MIGNDVSVLGAWIFCTTSMATGLRAYAAELQQLIASPPPYLTRSSMTLWRNRLLVHHNEIPRL
jgi:hypothetical protein